MAAVPVVALTSSGTSVIESFGALYDDPTLGTINIIETDFPLSARTTRDPDHASLAMAPDGSFLVAWSSINPAGKLNSYASCVDPLVAPPLLDPDQPLRPGTQEYEQRHSRVAISESRAPQHPFLTLQSLLGRKKALPLG